ncbi:FYVE zinc finger-domain-containing protein [Leptodontidium sp. 2 PMI_412]|nr:FYVE zinc finger-domain-containing protein [Leptodontidium sp. 2 PMI_412]
MNSRGLPGRASTPSSALDERPLPPLPISDEDDMAGEVTLGVEELTRQSPDAERLSVSSRGIHQASSNFAASSTSLAGDLEGLPVGPLRTPLNRPSSEVNDQVVNTEASNVAADGQMTPPANLVTTEGGSFAAAAVEPRIAVSASRLTQSPHLRNADRAPRPPRNIPRSENSSGSDSAGESGLRGPIASRARSRQQTLDGAPNMDQTQFVVPKWQPDATVTLCPICRTQFSFFVRKHHCRKCGRVVCGSCSPHRITIPYQYIVQPPAAEEISSTPRTRPRLDSGRTGSSPMVNNLGGGERVRLCNPCVPDPNIAPPQVPESRNSQPRPAQQGHSRSVSSTAASTQSRSSTYNPSISSSFYAQRRPREPSNLNSYNASTSSYTERNSRLRPEDLQSRSRSSTVGTNRDNSNMGNSASLGQWTGTPGRSEHPQINSSRSSPAPRPVIKEEDECWICHKELPSRNLPDWENVRAEHVNNCLSLAMQGPSTSTSPSPSPGPNTIPSSQSPRTSPTIHAESSRNPRTTPSIAPPIANTPEARMAARERAHAAVVLASSSTSPIRRSGVFPYKATEKDCIDDAECTICLEEFEVGEDMGRLECFCRFHLKCIREWFVNRPGQCPVHQHGAGY